MNPSTETSDGVARERLRAFVERIERMNEEKAAINADISDIYKEAKGDGFDTKVLKKIIADRSKDANERLEFEAVYDLYAAALGMIAEPDFEEPRVQVQARVREATSSATPEHDPETGEITESQPAPQAERDLTQPALGQVAHMQGASEATEAHNLGQAGSTPAPATIFYPAPGVVVMETCPPEGALAHPYAACWPVRDIDVSEGVREPIVKIGKLILDGRGRMFASRGWDGGKGQEYPVVQYDGTDPLMDCIRWNLASRPGIHAHNLNLIAGKLCKLEPTRADEIMQAFGLEVVEAAQ